MSEEEQTRMQEKKITYDIFKAFHKENPNLDNSEYYEQFPTVNQGTIRNWKSKVNKKVPIDKVKVMSEEEAMQIVLSKEDKTPGYDKSRFAGIPFTSQLKIIEEFEANPPEPAPNTPILPIPMGGGKPELGIDKYLKIDAEHKEIELNIPASVVFDPEKNKKLGEYS